MGLCSSCETTLKADVGDVVKFDQGFGHNVFTMPGDAAAYENCSFKGGKNLGVDAPVEVAIGEGDAGKILYFGCELPGHCTVGKMRIAFEISQVKKKKEM